MFIKHIMCNKTSVIVNWLTQITMSRIGSKFQWQVFLSLLTLSAFYCIEETDFDDLPDGIETSDGIDPELLMEIKPIPEPYILRKYLVTEKLSEQLKPTNIERKLQTHVSNRQESWQTYSKKSFPGRKYSKPTTNLEPIYSTTRTMNIKPKYPILFAILKKHLLRMKNSLSSQSSSLKELIFELEASLCNSSLDNSMQSRVESKHKPIIYPNQNEEEKSEKKGAMTKILHKFIKAVLAKLNTSRTERYFNKEKPLDHVNTNLIVSAKKDLVLPSEQVKDGHEPNFEDNIHYPKTYKNIKTEQSSSKYTNQKNWEGERNLEKTSTMKVEFTKERMINYVSTENYPTTADNFKFLKLEIVTPPRAIALPLSAKKEDDFEVFVQIKKEEVIDEHTSPTPFNHNYWVNEHGENKAHEIEKSTKLLNYILRQENMVTESSMPKQITDYREFITQDAISISNKNPPWWSEEEEELEVEKKLSKLSAKVNDITKLKDEQTLNSNDEKETSKINFTEQLWNSIINNTSKENTNKVLFQDPSTTKFSKKTKSVKLVTTTEKVNLETKTSSTNASTQVSTKKNKKIEQTPLTEPIKIDWKDIGNNEKELNEKNSKKPLSYNISNENLVKNTSIVKPKTDNLENGTQVKRGVPPMVNLNILEKFDAVDKSMVERQKTLVLRNSSSWKKFLKDIENEQQFFFEEPLELSEHTRTEAKNSTNMKVNKQDHNKGKFKIFPRKAPTGILGDIMRLSRNLLVPNYILSLLNFDVSVKK